MFSCCAGSVTGTKTAFQTRFCAPAEACWCWTPAPPRSVCTDSSRQWTDWTWARSRSSRPRRADRCCVCTRSCFLRPCTLLTTRWGLWTVPVPAAETPPTRTYLVKESTKKKCLRSCSSCLRYRVASQLWRHHWFQVGLMKRNCRHYLSSLHIQHPHDQSWLFSSRSLGDICISCFISALTSNHKQIRTTDNKQYLTECCFKTALMLSQFTLWLKKSMFNFLMSKVT